MQKFNIEIIFKRTLLEVVCNLFRPKAKRHPRVVNFQPIHHELHQTFLLVIFEKGGPEYTYPLHCIQRIKVSRIN